MKIQRLLILAMPLLVLAAGCQHTVRRTDNLTAPLAAGQIVTGQTDFGKIKAHGQDTTDCHLQARLFAQAPTRREAKEILAQSQAKLVPNGSGLVIIIEHPPLPNNRTVGGDLILKLPHDSGLDLYTDFGHIEAKHIRGGVTLRTDFGDIICTDIAGPIHLNTDFGKIKARQVSSQDLSMNSDFGNLLLVYSDDTPTPMTGNLYTDFGSVKVCLPETFSGTIKANTDFGKACCSRPIHIQGTIKKEHLQGYIGDGDSRLTAKTDFGNVRIQ